MKRFLLATAAAGFALAAPAFAQTTTPVPSDPPPITTPGPETAETPAEAAAPLATPEAAPAVTAQTTTEPGTTPVPQEELTGEAQAATPGAPEAQATTEGSTTPAPQTAETPAPAAVASAPPVDAQAAITAPEAEASTAAEAHNPTPTVQAQNEVLATPVSASDVCSTRTTSVHFGARGSALSRENQNAIQYATDAASACSLQTITIVDSAEGRTHSRRADAVRQTLIRQGVAQDRITIAQEANADADAASTGRLDIRMEFAGAATQAALEPGATSGANAAAEPTLQVAENVVTPSPAPAPRAAAPAPTPDALPPMPEAAPATPAPGVEDLAEPAAPPVETQEMQPGT